MEVLELWEKFLALHPVRKKKCFIVKHSEFAIAISGYRSDKLIEG